MTPDEFNKVGQQVQLEIFESYFEELNQLQRQPQTNTEFSDRVQQIQNKIATFEVEGTAVFENSFSYFYLPSNLHRLGEIYYNDTTIVQPVQQSEYLLINRSPLTSPTLSQPIYVQRGEHTSAAGPPPVLHDKIFVYPTSIKSLIKCSYVKTPAQINWTFTVNALGAYIFTTTGAQNFEIDVSEQTEIILKILQYSGVIIRDPQIVQAAAQLVAQDTVNEKS